MLLEDPLLILKNTAIIFYVHYVEILSNILLGPEFLRPINQAHGSSITQWHRMNYALFLSLWGPVITHGSV